MRKLLVVFGVLAASVTAGADVAGHPVTLWRAAGQTNSVYLLGSIHLLRAGDYPLPSIIDTAYSDAEILVMELDMDDLDATTARRLFNEHGVLEDGTTLRELIGEDAYRRAAALASANDIPLELLARSEPWLAAVTVEMMALYRIGFQPSLGVEMYLKARAEQDGKPIEGLEAIEEQLAFLDGLSLDAQSDMLIQTLEQIDDIDDTIDEIVRAWRHGNTAFLESGLLDSFAGHDELNDVLVTSRNRRWADRIDALLDDPDDYLVVVGALHLVGDAGVPQLLSRKGIEIQQLSEPASIR